MDRFIGVNVKRKIKDIPHDVQTITAIVRLTDIVDIHRTNYAA